MKSEIGNYAEHAKFWDWGNLDHDRAANDGYWYQFERQYGNRVLIPMCALGEAVVRNFRFDIPPVDFCYAVDFGHLHTVEDVKRALLHINYHLRDGGGLVVETGLRVRGKTTDYTPPQVFMPKKQVYPHLKVWKVGDTLNDAQTGRCHISQMFCAENESGHVESFDHAFYMQSYRKFDWTKNPFAALPQWIGFLAKKEA